ncbi:hypothetical protein Tco_0179907 [Tanacetum coccineum]
MDKHGVPPMKRFVFGNRVTYLDSIPKFISVLWEKNVEILDYLGIKVPSEERDIPKYKKTSNTELARTRNQKSTKRSKNKAKPESDESTSSNHVNKSQKILEIPFLTVKKRRETRLLFTRRPTFHPHGKTKGKSKSKGALVNSSKLKYNGRVIKVKSRDSLPSLKIKATSVMEKAQLYVGFALSSLTKEAQAVTSRNDSLAILECII